MSKFTMPIVMRTACVHSGREQHSHTFYYSFVSRAGKTVFTSLMFLKPEVTCCVFLANQEANTTISRQKHPSWGTVSVWYDQHTVHLSENLKCHNCVHHMLQLEHVWDVWNQPAVQCIIFIVAPCILKIHKLLKPTNALICLVILIILTF
jgi:hypothetical protein